jgi:hypothetical protein
VKNPEGDRGVVEANFVWILRYAQNDSLFFVAVISICCTQILCVGLYAESTPLKPKEGLNGAPGA